ncbi:MAG: sugar phosphate nucleotidyltransferase [Vicinamibacterales bacterium]
MTSRLRHAIVLTAGFGTRLRPLTNVRAKPAIPLAGTPMIERIIGSLVSHGVLDLVLNLHYRPESIASIVGDGHHLGARVRYSWEQPVVLGSAGGPRQAAPILGVDPFLVVNGDTLTDVDVSALADAHERSGALVTLALTPNAEPDRYGGVRLGPDGIVTGFARRGPDACGSFHFVGIQATSVAAFHGVPLGAVANSVGEVYDRLLLTRPGSIRGFVCEARFWDIGSIVDYWTTSIVFAARELLPAGAAGSAVTGTLGIGTGTSIDPTASVRQSILWDRVTVSAHARLERCIVTDDVQVPTGACYTDALVTAAPNGSLHVSPRPLA